jgi:hypothetical protein
MDNQCELFLNSTLDNGWLYLATGTIPVSNDFPRGLYLWHRFSRVIFVYFCQDLSPLKQTRAAVCCQHGQVWQCKYNVTL